MFGTPKRQVMHGINQCKSYSIIVWKLEQDRVTCSTWRGKFLGITQGVLAWQTFSVAAWWSSLDCRSQLSLSNPEKSGLSPNDALGNFLKHLLHPENIVKHHINNDASATSMYLHTQQTYTCQPFLSQGCKIFILQVPGFLIENLIISGDNPKTSDAVPNNSKLPNVQKHNLISSTFSSENQRLY